MPGGMHGCQGECMVMGGVVAGGGGMCGCGGHAWLGGVLLWGGREWLQRGGMRRIRQDTVNERAVRILLECILV